MGQTAELVAFEHPSLTILKKNLSVFRVDRPVYREIDGLLGFIAQDIKKLALLNDYAEAVDKDWPRSAAYILKDLKVLARGEWCGEASESAEIVIDAAGSRNLIRKVLLEEVNFGVLVASAHGDTASNYDVAMVGQATNRRVLETGYDADHCGVCLVNADGRMRLRVTRGEVDEARRIVKADPSVVRSSSAVRLLVEARSALIDPKSGKQGLEAIVVAGEVAVARFDVARLRTLSNEVERPERLLTDLKAVMNRTRAFVREGRIAERNKTVGNIQRFFVDKNAMKPSFKIFLTQGDSRDLEKIAKGGILVYSENGSHAELGRGGVLGRVSHRAGDLRPLSAAAYMVSDCYGIMSAPIPARRIQGAFVEIDREKFMSRVRVSSRPDKVWESLRSSWAVTESALRRETGAPVQGRRIDA